MDKKLQKNAKIKLDRLLGDRYSLKACIDLYEMENLTDREKEILQYGFEEGRKCELLVTLYDLFNGNKDAMKYVSDRVTQRIDELKLLIEDKDYSNLAEYLKQFRKNGFVCNHDDEKT